MDIKNAKREFIDFVNDHDSDVLCAMVDTESTPDFRTKARSEERHIILKKGYTPEEYTHFLNQLDFKYDSGFGSQEVFGCIWFADNSWAIRNEYDGSEWWEMRHMPDIPLELLE